MAGVDGTNPVWFDEIDLDPARARLRMGTRSLGNRPWLVVDRWRDRELALKRRLLSERHGEVFAVAPDADQAAAETLELVVQALASRSAPAEVDGGWPASGGLELDSGPDRGLDRIHDLDRAGRLVQEDLCLLRPVDDRWVLAGASLCFPSRWRLADKFERALLDVHGPVAGYRDELNDRVDSLLDRLAERRGGSPGQGVVWRRNWFVHPDGSLFQPNRPVGGDPVVPAARCLGELFLRSERQTLRALPSSGWILFTIRVQQAPLGVVLADADRRARFVRFLAEADVDLVVHRGMSAAQVGELRTALA